MHLRRSSLNHESEIEAASRSMAVSKSKIGLLTEKKCPASGPPKRSGEICRYGVGLSAIGGLGNRLRAALRSSSVDQTLLFFAIQINIDTSFTRVST